MTENRQSDIQMTDNRQKTEDRQEDAQTSDNFSVCQSDSLSSEHLSSGSLPSDIFVTASILLEYLFCPRFIYFMNCLCIDQNEDKRFKVLKGREVHDGKERTNIDYLRKRIGCVDKEIGGHMVSEKYHLKGIVDEVLTLSDDTMAPLDYKYAEYKDTVFRTQRYQSVFYGLLIKGNYGKDVNRGFICYTRSKNLLKEIQITDMDFIELQAMIAEIIDITQKCYYPKGTKFKTQCIDCCYRNICV